VPLGKKKKKGNIWNFGNLPMHWVWFEGQISEGAQETVSKMSIMSKMSKMFSNLQPGQCRVGECGYFAQDASVAGGIPVRS
jgi:hypothetical protein